MHAVDPRNQEILVHVGGELKPRNEAKVSVFDSSVQGGDAVWEGLRIYRGRVADLDRHLDRLFDSAHALDFRNVPSRDKVRHALFETLRANGMTDGAHVRLTLTRGGEETHFWHEPALEPKRLHACGTGRMEGSGLRSPRHQADHLVDPAQQPAMHRLQDPPLPT